jgi:alanyl-tRNA synthetase
MLRIIGRTTDGQLALGGVFRLEDTFGIPLDFALHVLKNNGLVPNWVDFYTQARSNGWKHKTVIQKLSQALVDVYGPQFRDTVIERLNHLKEN